MPRGQRPGPVPNVYEICTVCGYDHDLPLLSSAALAEARARHTNRDSLLPDDFLAAGQDGGR